MSTRIKSIKKVNILGACTIALLGWLLFPSRISRTPPADDQNIVVEIYLTSRLTALEKELVEFQRLVDQHTGQVLLQQQFRKARLSYKQLAPLSEYFAPSLTKLLNAPAVDWVVDGMPDQVNPPHGFQVIETVLFGQPTRLDYDLLKSEMAGMLKTVRTMLADTHRIQRLTNVFVWDAIRASIIRLTSQGITGFDSPVAFYSIAEARATLQSLKKIIFLYASAIKKTDPTLLAHLLRQIDQSFLFLSQQTSFNAFDRYTFIRNFLNPLYKSIIETRQALGVTVPGGLQPVNANATSFFDNDFMNLDFFSPPEGFRVTADRIALGKKLFNDPILSGNKTRSCASCHQPEKAFTDGLKTPYALDNTSLLSRNTPTIWNSVFQASQFADGRTTLLENQLAEVVHNSDEMNGSLKFNTEELKKIPEYQQLFEKAYPGKNDTIVAFNIANAISSYVRSLYSFNAVFDQVMREQKKSFSPEEKRGFNLFAGKAKCATCHYIPLFNGLVPPEFNYSESEVLGVPATVDKKNAVLDRDMGKYNFTTSPVHRYSFKTPTLRNITLTAPYMHNGVYATLEEVMDFYNNGGGAGLGIAPPNQTLPPEKLGLSPQEIAAIIAFMKTLTDTPAY